MQNRAVSARILSMQKGNTVKDTGDTAVEQMFKAGAHYGYSKTRRHPSVSAYIYATKNKGDIIDLEKTSALLEEAKNLPTIWS